MKKYLQFIKIFIVIICVLLTLTLLVILAFQQDWKKDQAGYAQRFKSFKVCNDMVSRDSVLIKYCETLYEIQKNKAYFSHKLSVYQNIQSQVTNFRREADHKFSVFNDDPFYLQERYAQLIFKKLSIVENWYYVSHFPGCSSRAYNYKSLSSYLSQCERTILNTWSELSEKNNQISSIINEYSNLDPSYHDRLEAMTKKLF